MLNTFPLFYRSLQSLVLLTRLPFVPLFTAICAQIAPLYFDECFDAADAADAAASADASATTATTASLLPPASSSVDSPAARAAGQAVLDCVCAQIGAWPPLAAGRRLQLPLLGRVWTTELGARAASGGGGGAPKTNAHAVAEGDSPNGNNGTTTPASFCAALDGDVWRSLGGMLGHVHLLWELVLIGEPVVVMAQSPAAAAQMVDALRG